MTGSWERSWLLVHIKKKKKSGIDTICIRRKSAYNGGTQTELAESCDSLKLCKIRAAYYVENGEVQLNADDILKCYDTFEWLVERLFDTMQSVFYRVSQIDDALRISVHIVAEADLWGLMSERPELNVQQEDENEWFIGCIVFRKRGGR